MSRIGCVSHARRKFYVALKSGDRQAIGFIAQFRKLYRIESQTKDLTDDQRHEIRQREAPQIWAAMKERARELKNAARRNPADERADGERDLQAKLAELDGPDRALATRIHELVMATVPTLVPRTWYGMPAWSHGGKTICFFQPAARFKVRYATFGFQPDATLDDGPMWADRKSTRLNSSHRT